VTVRDTTAPAVNFASPDAGDIVSGNVALVAVASDAVGVSQVEFFAGSQSLGLGNEIAAGYFTGSWNTSALANGTVVTLRATARDAAGNAGQSPNHSVTVDRTATAPPTITTGPASLTIVSGATATLSVVATGGAPLSYQWYQGTSPSTTTPAAGAIGSSFTTPALSTTTSYWVSVNNPYGTANSGTATVTIGAAPAITTQPLGQTIASGTTATLSVVATSTAPLSYQWYRGRAQARRHRSRAPPAAHLRRRR
jgi:hypothetical protein